MRTILFTFLFIISSLQIVNSQVVQSNFTGEIVPQYMGSGTSTRLPYVYRATVSGLLPNAYYRYYLNACIYNDFGGTNSGAGNPLFIHGNDYRYSTATNLSNPGGYDSILTNGSGSYTGWFGFVNTGNARFTAGNYVYPTITLDSAGSGSTLYRFALNDSIKVLGYSATSDANSCTGLYGISLATPKNIITVYDNISNSGRPLSMVFAESDGIDTTVMTNLVKFYKDSVDSRDGRWGSMIPNLLPGGVKRVNVLSLSDASIVRFKTDDDGIWPSGTNTVNPTGGADNPLRLDEQDVFLLINTGNVIADNFSLEQNFPNPFNPDTKISFSIPLNGYVKLKVYDVLGKEVSVLYDGNINAGNYQSNFNGRDLQSGVYFYRMEFSGDNGITFSDFKKLILVK